MLNQPSVDEDFQTPKVGKTKKQYLDEYKMDQVQQQKIIKGIIKLA